MDALSIKRSAIGSASGSIDVLGGYAKAAGSLALRSLSEPKTTVLLTETSEIALRFSSTRHGRFSCDKRAFDTLVAEQASLADLRGWIESVAAPVWTQHLIGILYLFALKHRWNADEGLAFAVASDIPENQGLSSGAALKMACIRALEKLTTLYHAPGDVERALARVDSELLGLPFDVSATIAATQGRPGCLLPINCRDGSAQAPIELPRGITFFSWTRRLPAPRDRSWYYERSVAAAMGQRISQTSARHSQSTTLPKPAVFETQIADRLPSAITGRAFETDYGPLHSEYAALQPDCAYDAKRAFSFSIRENHRCEQAIHLLANTGLKFKRQTIEIIGDLLWESHFENRRDGLSLKIADEMISALIHAGPENGIFGGRLDWLGHDCTVIALAEKKAIAYLRRLARDICPDGGEPFQIA